MAAAASLQQLPTDDARSHMSSCPFLAVLVKPCMACLPYSSRSPVVAVSRVPTDAHVGNIRQVLVRPPRHRNARTPPPRREIQWAQFISSLSHPLFLGPHWVIPTQKSRSSNPPTLTLLINLLPLAPRSLLVWTLCPQTLPSTAVPKVPRALRNILSP